MKKLFSLILAGLLLIGCSTQTKNEKEIMIITTIFPVTDLTQRVVGNQAQVKQLMPNNGDDGHHWEPSAQDIAALEEADVFIYNGAGMETWVQDVLSGLSNQDLLIIEASKDVQKIDGHHHEHEEEQDHHEESHEEHIDPHTWSSPLNAKTQMETISRELQSKFSDLSETLKNNTETNKHIFDILNQEYRQTLQSKENRIMVVQHEAYGYLAHDYNLEQIGVEGIVPTSEPDAARLAEIMDVVKKNNVKTIFFEGNVSDNVAQTIAQETGTQVLILYPLATQVDNMDLVEMFKKNLESLDEGL